MFKKLQELLEAGKIDKEVAEILDNEIGTALKEVRDEAASWRVKYKELQQNHEEVAKSKQSLEEQLNSLDEKIKKAKEEGKAELVKELEAERASKEELAKRLSEMEGAYRQTKIQSEIQRALSKFDVIDTEIVAEALSKRVDLVEGEVKFKNNDEFMPLEDGVKSFFEAKPNLLRSVGKPGSGVEHQNSGSFTKKKSQMSDDEIEEFVQKYGQDAFINLPN